MIDSAQLSYHLGSKRVRSAVRMSMLAEGELSYKDFIEQLYSDLDDAIYRLQKNRELHQKSSEDLLSNWILDNLNTRGYDAVHEGKTGGHVDLTIKLGTYCLLYTSDAADE